MFWENTCVKNEDDITGANTDGNSEITTPVDSSIAPPEKNNPSVQDGSSKNLDFTVKRLIFSKQGILLENGILEDNEMLYTKVYQAELPSPFSAAIWKSPQALKEILEFIHKETAEYFTQNQLLTIILPEEWATIREVFIPDNLPEEVKENHIHWTFAVTGWEDGEYPRYGYEPVGEGSFHVVYLRESYFKFSESVAKTLGAKLVQLSISALPDLNLLLTESPEKNNLISYKRKSSFASILLLMFIISSAAASYYFFTKSNPPVYYYFNFSKNQRIVSAPKEVPSVPTVIKEKTAETDSIKSAVPVDSIAPSLVDTSSKSEKPPSPIDSLKKTEITPAEKKAATPPSPVVAKKTEPKPPAVKTSLVSTQTPLSNLFMLLHKNVDIYYMSFTGETIRCKFSSVSDKANSVLQEMKSTGTLKSADIQSSGVENGKNNAIITAAFLDKIIAAYSFPEISVIKNALKEAGFKPNAQNFKYDTFEGSSERITSILKVIDNNHILLYRIRITQTAPNNYVITLEY